MDYSYLSLAFQDRLHQNYRAKLIPGFYDVVNSAYKEGSLGVALSGSGSSIIAFSNSNEENIAQSMINTFLPKVAKAAPRLTVVVVLPTPPF